MYSYFSALLIEDSKDKIEQCINNGNVKECDEGARLRRPSEGWSECTDVNFVSAKIKERYRYCAIKENCILEEILAPDSPSCTK